MKPNSKNEPKPFDKYSTEQLRKYAARTNTTRKASKRKKRTSDDDEHDTQR